MPNELIGGIEVEEVCVGAVRTIFILIPAMLSPVLGERRIRMEVHHIEVLTAAGFEHVFQEIVGKRAVVKRSNQSIGEQTRFRLPSGTNQAMPPNTICALGFACFIGP
ncbi:MAG: hypothetical protein R2873_35490 [Caldilineaceae bacterium]